MIKKLIDLPSGHKAEAVYFEDDRKQVICFSTQLNCAVGCGFCASTRAREESRDHKTINLTTKDMLEQIFQMETHSMVGKVMLYSIMGEGEPFLNYDNVIKVMHLLEKSDPESKIAVSTSGYKIRKFAHEKFKVPVKLQVSVHSAIEYKRAELVPNAPTVYAIQSDLEYYHKHNKGEVELMFTLIEDVNDGILDMQYLIDLYPNEHIKLGVLNGDEPSSNINSCLKYLQDVGMSVELYDSPGSAEGAACGMTRGEVIYGKGKVPDRIMKKDLKEVFNLELTKYDKDKMAIIRENQHKGFTV